MELPWKRHQLQSARSLKKLSTCCVWVQLCFRLSSLHWGNGEKGINMSLLCVCFHINHPFYKLTQFRVYSCRGHPCGGTQITWFTYVKNVNNNTVSRKIWIGEGKQRQQPMLVVTSVQVHQQTLTWQRGRYRQQTSFLFQAPLCV